MDWRLFDIRVENALSAVKQYALQRCGQTTQVPFDTFRSEVLATPEFSPVFFLSTGRTGTGFLAALVNRSPAVKCFHGPRPRLQHEGRTAYELLVDAEAQGRDATPLRRAIGMTFIAARQDHLYPTYVRGRTYMESNNSITFMAAGIREVMPHARFVHVHRHPGEVVRSGMRRHWYGDADKGTAWRITPRGGDAADRWQAMSPLQRCCWYWSETNAFIERFMEEVPAASRYTFSASAMDEDRMMSLLAFLGVELSIADVRTALGQKVNSQQGPDYAAYRDWPEADRVSLASECGALADRYGYEL